eukprot:1181914-Prorocentrum_minimum.AAC.2
MFEIGYPRAAAGGSEGAGVQEGTEGASEMRVTGEGGSSGRSTTMIGTTEWSATGLTKASLAGLAQRAANFTFRAGEVTLCTGNSPSAQAEGCLLLPVCLPGRVPSTHYPPIPTQYNSFRCSCCVGSVTSVRVCVVDERSHVVLGFVCAAPRTVSRLKEMNSWMYCQAHSSRHNTPLADLLAITTGSKGAQDKERIAGTG